MAFAVTDMEFDARTIPESYILLRDVKRVPYEELYLDPDKLAKEFDAAHPAAIVENDCVIVTGESLLQAFDRLEVMELTAASILKSQRLGRMVHISDEEVAALKETFMLYWQYERIRYQGKKVKNMRSAIAARIMKNRFRNGLTLMKRRSCALHKLNMKEASVYLSRQNRQSLRRKRITM